MFMKALVSSLALSVSIALAQLASYCDSTSGICFGGFTDATLDMTLGFVLPTDTTSDEYILQMVAPASYGYTGLSVGGTMANSLFKLFVLWPNDGKIVLGSRWTAGYMQPTPYAGPVITLLPDSTANGTRIKATFRCQNCTIWDGGSFGSGDLNGFELVGYVANTKTPVDDPSDPASNFVEHDQFNLFGADLSTTHSSSYESYLSSAGPCTSAPSSPSTTSTSATSTTSSAPVATQTKYGQCGGDGWSGPTVCTSGSTCVADGSVLHTTANVNRLCDYIQL